MASYPIYQFYAELDNFKPKIWRRFQVSNNITVARLGYIIQVLFEMTASHLMSLKVPREKKLLNHLREKQPNVPESTLRKLHLINKKDTLLHYEIMNSNIKPFISPYDDVHTIDAATAKLCHAVSTQGDKIYFNYDFGDDWQVSLKLEKIFTDKTLSAKDLPRVLEGAGFGIIEDCGGTGGLDALVKAFQKKKGANYKQAREWLGVDDFDINAFDINDMNFRLKKIPRIYKQSYEDMLAPTQQSIDLIERRYLTDKQ